MASKKKLKQTIADLKTDLDTVEGICDVQHEIIQKYEMMYGRLPEYDVDCLFIPLNPTLH